MAAHHERFLDQHAGATARLDQRQGLVSGQRDRLLAQDVLAGRRRLDRDRQVQMVGHPGSNRHEP
jgi:hypothetical protein